MQVLNSSFILPPVVVVVVAVVEVVVVLTAVSMRKCLAAVEKGRRRAEKNFNILLDSLSGLSATELDPICH